MSSNGGYDARLLAEAPEVTKQQRQEFYDPALLVDREPEARNVTPPPGARSTEDLETGRSKEYAPVLSSSSKPAAKRPPFYKTRNGIIAIVVLTLVIIGVAVGAGVGASASKNSDSGKGQSGAAQDTPGQPVASGSTTSTAVGQPVASSAAPGASAAPGGAETAPIGGGTEGKEPDPGPPSAGAGVEIDAGSALVD